MASLRSPLADALPDFPWDQLTSAKQRASTHPDGVIDLSMGTPVDDVPASVQAALIAAANAPGYPVTQGTPQFRQAVATWLATQCGVSGLTADAVIPTIGLKEAVALLPTLLGIGPSATVVIPELAYPTYEVSALAAGANVLRTDDIEAWQENESVALVWLNSPSNPTGRVLSVETLRAARIAAARLGAVLASDECYLDLWWEGVRPSSVLADAVCDGDHTGLLALHSLSKRSNLAGYRVGSVSGDATLVADLLAARKHLGLMVPVPNLAAATAAYLDDASVVGQRERYRARRDLLIPALAAAGLQVEHSEASLFIWAHGERECWSTVNQLAEIGVLVAPGEFYGPAGARHVRVALTATDDAIARAAARLHALR